MHDRTVDIDEKDDFIIASKDSLSYGIDYLLNNWINKNKNNICLVIDEAHHATAKSYRRIIDELKDENSKSFKMIGLTATPFRTSESENKLLKKVFENDIIYEISLKDLIAKGILAEPIFEELNTKINATNQLTDRDIKAIEAFDSIPEDVAREIAENKKRNNLIVNHYIKNKEKYGQVLIFAININHAIALNSLFKAKGIASDYIVSSIKDGVTKVTISNEENAMKLKEYKNGNLDVLINVNILTEGTDLPNIQTVFLTRPTISSTLMTQMIGRGLRGTRAGGTEKAYIVSFIDDWKGRIAWVNPKKLIDDEEAVFVDKEYNKIEKETKLIAISKIEEFAKIMDDTVDTGELKSLNFIERIPIGVYSFLVTVKTEEEEYTKSCNVLVYDDFKIAYEDFVDNLDIIFQEKHLEDKEFLDDDQLESLSSYVEKEFFEGYSKIIGYDRNDIKDMLRYYALKGVKPEFLKFKEREKYDISKLAHYIVDNDLGIKAEKEYIYEEWNKPNSFWKTMFSHNEEYFINEIQLERNKIIYGIFNKNNKKPEIMYEKTNIEKLSLSQIRKEYPIIWRNIVNEVFEKSIDEQGYYHSALSDYKSKSKKNLQIDHIKPMSKGGLTTIDNLQVLTREENQLKRDKYPYTREHLLKDKIGFQKNTDNLENKNEEFYYKLRNEIQKLYDNNNYEEIIEISKIGIKNFPNEGFFYTNLGIALLNLNELDEAEKYFDKAIKIDNKYADAYLEKGKLLKYKNMYEKALTFIDKSIKLNPKNYEAYIFKGNIHIYYREYEKAIQCCNKSINIFDENPYTYVQKGDCLRYLRKYKEALKQYEIAFKLDENYAEAYFQKALTLDAMRSYKEAIENYEEYIKLCPDDPAVYNNAGYTLYKMKKYDDALNYYNKALEIDPKYKIAISNKQDLLKKLK